jgi:hypothetical protein
MSEWLFASDPMREWSDRTKLPRTLHFNINSESSIKIFAIVSCSFSNRILRFLQTGTSPSWISVLKSLYVDIHFSMNSKNRGRSVNEVTPKGWKVWNWFPTEVRTFLFVTTTITAAEGHYTLYKMYAGDSMHWDRSDRSWSWPFIPIYLWS